VNSGLVLVPGVFWGFLPGPRELVLVAVVVVLLYGRSPLARRLLGRLGRVTRGGVKRLADRPGFRWFSGRWGWVVVALATLAMTAWVATWITVLGHRTP
jgi:hypothetical protein